MPPHTSHRARHAARLSPALSALRGAADRLDVAARAGRFTREVSLTLAAVLLLGMGAAGAQTSGSAGTTSPVAAVAAPTSAPSPTQAPVTPTRTSGLAAHVPDLSVPRPKPAPPKPAAARQVAAAPHVDRWLPTGTGMWLHDWSRSESGHALEVVARAKKVGLTHLYVQTGSTRKGWIGERTLSQLMPATKGTGIQVIAWDFPKLIDPEADARRMARAAWWHRPGSPMISAVAPDVETAAEGTNLGGDRVERYYRELRKRLPARTAILATVPWPSEKRTGIYPYATTAKYSDAFVPMAYWYNRSPSVVTRTSMQWLAKFNLPVMPVGQGYDGRLDAPYLKPDPAPDKSVAAFIYNARAHGAQSLSLWSWQTTGPLQWGELAKAAGRVGPQPPAAKPAPPVVVASPSTSPEPAVVAAEPSPPAEKPTSESEGDKQKAEQDAKESDKKDAQRKANQRAPGRKR